MTFLSRIKLLWRLSNLLKTTKPGRESEASNGVQIILAPGLVLPVQFIKYPEKKAPKYKKVTAQGVKAKIKTNKLVSVPEEFEEEIEKF